MSATPPNLALVAACGLASVGSLAYLAHAHHSSEEFEFWAISAAIFSTVGFIALLIARAVILGRRREIAAGLEKLAREPASTYGHAAGDGWLRALLARKDVFVECGRFWSAKVPRDGPRVICINVDLEPVPEPPDIFEPADLSASRAIGSQERRKRIWQVCGLVAACAYFGWVVLRHAAGVVWIPFLVSYICTIIYALYRLGIRPFELGGRVVDVACVQVRRLGRVDEFTREDSCVIISNAPRGHLRAHIVRRDGCAIKVDFASSHDDPALHQLIARWSWRDGAWARHVDEPVMNNRPLPDVPADPG